MSENKFIQHLKGKATAGSVVEIKNQATPASFANMPSGTPNANNVYADVHGNATVVAQGTTNWKLDGANLVLASNVSGDGNDYTGVYGASGAGLWVNATYTFPSTGDPNHPVAMIFNPNTKWVLKLCGDNLLSNGANTIDFSLVITIGSGNIITKNFTIAEQANKFCKEFIIDFAESNADLIKASGTATMQVQLLCATASATARIYNGMTVFTALQRKVDASVVSADFANVEEVIRDGILPSDYFSNAAFIGQVNDGEQAYAVFERDGDNVNLAGWTPKDDIATTTQLNDEITARENADLGLQNQINTNKGTMDGHIANTSNPHQVTKTQVGLGNVDNTSDLNKPISTATQNALDLKMPISTKYGAALSLTINSTTYVVTAQLKDQDGNNLGTAQTIDLPLESVVVSGAYDSTTKEVVLTLQDGSTIRFSVADLVSGLQTEITALNMLSADLVDDTGTTHKFVTTTEKSTWNGKQDAISDLATIRAGASAGATALQAGDNVSELVNDAGYLVMGDLTGFVTRTTAQTISGLKTFTADIVLSGTTSIKNTTSGVSYTMLYRDTSGIHVGTSTQALLLAGSGTRPTFNSNNMALLSDVPTAVSQLTNDSGFITNAVNDLQNYTLTSALATVATSGSYTDLSNKPTIPTVNNPTITITQGGVTKGSFTLNQASGDTIALDAGGGSGLPDQTGHAGEFLTTDGTDASWSDAIGYHPDLFDHKWADHQLNDVSWLRADTFSWQSGAVYEAAYQHLADDIDGKTLQSETVGGTTVQFYLADDGHKICPASEESNVAAIYTATGVAWYYIIDTVNQRFKLPRTEFGFTGLRSNVGDYVDAGLPNITGNWYPGLYSNVGGATSVSLGNYFNQSYNSCTASGAFKSLGQTRINKSDDESILHFDASLSNSIYGNSNTVQPPATEMYLYFYVGQFTQTALENTAGLNAELFNDKADINLQNATAENDFVIERQEPTALNNYTWYRKYRSGWVEQGGKAPTASSDIILTITLPVEMSDTNYTIKTTSTTGNQHANMTAVCTGTGHEISTTGFYIQVTNKNNNAASPTYTYWQVSGMAAN